MNWVSLLLSPTGRVGRGVFWAFVGGWFALDAVFRGAISAAARWSGNEVVVAVFFWLWIVFTLATYFPIIALAIKRLHDTGRSGYWMGLPIGATASGVLLIAAIFRQSLGSLLLLSLLCIVLGFGSLVLLYFWIQPGDDGRNEYGDA